VMCAIVLRFCGASAEAIAADYHMSEAHGMSEEGRARMESIAELVGAHMYACCMAVFELPKLLIAL